MTTPSMFEMFDSDTDMETKGIWADYGEFRVRIARAGGANKVYQQYIEKKLKPYRRMAQQGTPIPEAKSRALLADIFAKTIILDWEIADGENEDTSTIWKQGIHARDGSVLEFNEANVLLTLKALPNLLMDLQDTASSVTLFAKEDLEEDAKNS